MTTPTPTPAPVPPAAIEAALGTLLDDGEIAHPMFVRRLTAALSAAAPLIAAQAKAEALREFADDIRSFSGDPTAQHIEEMAYQRAATLEGENNDPF